MNVNKNKEEQNRPEEKEKFNYGTYDIIEEIGSGGGGIVYKAYHKNLKKYVVVKQIKNAAKGILDSRAEADILKNLRNTYLPQVYDFLEIDGEVFTVIDYIDGESLDNVLEREGRISQKKVFQWALQLADALTCMHNSKPPIIHSDIKPENIMLRANGDICLIDFNVSLALEGKKRASVGVSEGYSPPEQYWNMEMYRSVTGNASSSSIEQGKDRGKHFEKPSQRKTEYIPQEILEASKVFLEMKAGPLVSKYIGLGVDERSDIYSLGATLYHLLTGICPPGDFEKIVPLKKCKCNVSEGFEKIIEKMMELDAGKRYRNGGELLNALNNVHKIDSFYLKYVRNRAVTGIALATLYISSALMILFGFNMRNREMINLYNHTVEEAGVKIEEGEFAEAQRLIEDAILQIPSRIGAYEKEVLRLYTSGEYEECIRYGRNTVNSPPYYVESDSDKTSLGNILYIIGNAYYETGDYENAAFCLENAISYCPDNSAFYCDLGIVYAKAGNMDKAEEILSQSEGLGLGQTEIILIKGEMELYAGRPKQAVELFKQALGQIEGQDKQLRCVMLCAKAYDQLGDSYIDEEIAFLNQWKNSLGYRGELQIGEKLGDVYARNQEYEKSLKEFLALKDNGFVSYQLQENIAILYQQTDQFQFANEILCEMADLYPERYETFKRLAFLEADIQQTKANRERDYTKMREYYEKAVDLCHGEEDSDMEMQQLEAMIRELAAGNWFK